MGRPSHSPQRLEEAKKRVFAEMERLGAPGWRPVASILSGVVSVRLVQQFVAEYKFAQRQKRSSRRMDVVGKNVIWTMDGAITKENEKIENQVIKDRGTKCWVGFKRTLKASKGSDVIDALKRSFELNGKPLVLSSDNGTAYSNKQVSKFLRDLKFVHLRSLP